MLARVQGFAILLAITSVLRASHATNDEACPTWFHHSQEGPCVCGDLMKGVVSCDNATQRVGVLDCFCMTSNGDKGNTTVIGSCLFNCLNRTFWVTDNIYHPVYWNASELDSKTCGYLNRKGRLCSVCNDGHHVSAYSYDFTCFQCTSSGAYEVIKYISIAFLPLTLLYVLVLVFRISVTSPQLNSSVILCQILATPIYVRLLVQATKTTTIFPLVQALATLYGIWNLDFFRSVIPPICLPISTMQILALEYVVALYPLLLIIFSYVLLTAYERGFRVVVWLWRPFYKCLVRFRRPWNLRHSIIDAFATFLLLSYMKLLTTSVDLLIPVNVHNSYGISEGQYLYYDASIPFWEQAHLPYACSALIIVTVVIILPLVLLLLYPMQCFQKCLNRCGLNWQALRIFMECFQGCYRDRTDGGMECRYFAALNPLMQITSFIVYGYMLNWATFPVLAIMLIGVGITIIAVQPYKDPFSVYNKLDAVMMLLLAAHYLGIIIVNKALLRNHLGPIIFSAAVSLVPLVYITIIILRHLFPRQRMMRCFNLCKDLPNFMTLLSSCASH